MITCGLEKFIQLGKAQQHTWVFGGGGVGRIPVPPNSFIIIHHFDYWHFIDIPDDGALPAHTTVTVVFADGQNPVPGRFDFGVIGSFPVIIDFTDAAATLLDVQTNLALVFPGWTVVLFVTPGGYDFTFTTTAPGGFFNGSVSTFIPDPAVPPPLPVVTDGVFVGGTFSVITPGEFLNHSTHQLEFRSSKGRNHFLINEPVVIVPLTEGFYAYMDGTYYAKDTYMVHTESVQINILGVPPVENWGVTMNLPAVVSQEFEPPVGYGHFGGAGFATAREIIFDAAGPTQQYLPLTSDFDDTAVIPTQNRNQFQVDANNINALSNPQNKRGVFGNFKTYPLVNIDYILVNMNYNEFVKASNG